MLVQLILNSIFITGLWTKTMALELFMRLTAAQKTVSSFVFGMTNAIDGVRLPIALAVHSWENCYF
jgi:hypothetical protein